MPHLKKSYFDHSAFLGVRILTAQIQRLLAMIWTETWKQQQNSKLNIQVTVSSIHVYLFLRHAAQICSTWMTSCVHFKIIEG